jgi:hypothetical protein
MLGIDHQPADIGTIGPGADTGVFGRQRGRGRVTSHLWIGGHDCQWVGNDMSGYRTLTSRVGTIAVNFR